jgi:hypothetical protein
MENNTIYNLLDRFFLVFHTLFTLFNITGWYFKKVRTLHLVTMVLTLFSWSILGIWYGFGYCFCTDWHWRVREILGRPIESWSYIHFLIKEISGFNPDPYLVDKITFTVFLVCLILTITLNIRDRLVK